MASESKKFLLFKTLIAVGFALSIILLVQTISTYKYVTGELMMQEAERDTQRKVNTLVGAVRTAQTQDMELIGEILREFLEDWNRQVGHFASRHTVATCDLRAHGKSSGH